MYLFDITTIHEALFEKFSQKLTFLTWIEQHYQKEK